MWWSNPGLVLLPRLAAGAVLLAALTAAGCGFRPLYGNPQAPDSAVAELATIKVASIPDRLGQIVRNNLLERLSPRGEPLAPRYHLNVTLEKSKEGLAIRTDEIVTRYNLRLIARFDLTEAKSGSKVFSGRSRSFASYNLVRSDYANLSAERDAERRTAMEISDDIAARLALFLTRNGNAS